MGLEKVSDYLVFWRELFRCFPEIGMITPSSAQLARAMVRPVEEAKKPISILEAGPGTGSFTKRILSLMGPQDRLVICELNPRFMARLKDGLETNEDYLKHQDRVEFFLGPVQDLPLESRDSKFDVVVSSLPFSNFTPELVNEVLGFFKRALAEDGTLTFIEYLGIRKLTYIVSSPANRSRLKGVDGVIDSWQSTVAQRGKVKRETSFLNFPPAVTFRFEYST